MLNDPGLIVKPDTQKPQQQPRGQQNTFSVKKTTMMVPTENDKDQRNGPVHGTNHTLNQCKTFRKKSIHAHLELSGRFIQMRITAYNLLGEVMRDNLNLYSGMSKIQEFRTDA